MFVSHEEIVERGMEAIADAADALMAEVAWAPAAVVYMRYLDPLRNACEVSLVFDSAAWTGRGRPPACFLELAVEVPFPAGQPFSSYR